MSIIDIDSLSNLEGHLRELENTKTLDFVMELLRCELYKDVHNNTNESSTETLKDLGLLKGTEEEKNPIVPPHKFVG